MTTTSPIKLKDFLMVSAFDRTRNAPSRKERTGGVLAALFAFQPRRHSTFIGSTHHQASTPSPSLNFQTKWCILSPMTDEEIDEQFYKDTQGIAFPKLNDRQLAMLEPLGSRRKVRRGEFVFKAGQRDLGLAIILTGQVEAFESRDGQEQILATMGPRDVLGDVAMLMGTAALANARGAAEETELLELHFTQMRKAMAELPTVAEPLVRAFMMRRKRLLRDREFGGLRILAPE